MKAIKIQSEHFFVESGVALLWVREGLVGSKLPRTCEQQEKKCHILKKLLLGCSTMSPVLFSFSSSSSSSPPFCFQSFSTSSAPTQYSKGWLNAPISFSLFFSSMTYTVRVFYLFFSSFAGPIMDLELYYSPTMKKKKKKKTCIFMGTAWSQMTIIWWPT